MGALHVDDDGAARSKALHGLQAIADDRRAIGG